MKDILPLDQASDLLELEDQKNRTVQLQTLLKDATPELLEASVEQGVKLLDQLKGPMLDKVADTTDTAPWVNQIGICQVHRQN